MNGLDLRSFKARHILARVQVETTRLELQSKTNETELFEHIMLDP